MRITGTDAPCRRRQGLAPRGAAYGLREGVDGRSRPGAARCVQDSRNSARDADDARIGAKVLGQEEGQQERRADDQQRNQVAGSQLHCGARA